MKVNTLTESIVGNVLTYHLAENGCYYLQLRLKQKTGIQRKCYYDFIRLKTTQKNAGNDSFFLIYFILEDSVERGVPCGYKYTR